MLCLQWQTTIIDSANLLFMLSNLTFFVRKTQNTVMQSTFRIISDQIFEYHSASTGYMFSEKKSLFVM